MNIQDFYVWELSSRDTLDVKKVYIDMAGELVAGIMLSQIVYWHLPTKEGIRRLRVKHEGYWWLAKKATDWWEECRLSPKQAARSIEVLGTKNLIVSALYKFNGAPTTHIRILWPEFLISLGVNLPKGTNPIHLDGEMETDQTGNSLTETLPETTPETTKSKEGANAPRLDETTGELLPSKNDKPAAVMVYKEVMHCYPAKAWYDRIVAAVGEDGLALQKWRDVLMQWIGRGYSPKNVEGVLDVFRAGWKKHDAKPKAAKLVGRPDFLGGKYGKEIQH